MIFKNYIDGLQSVLERIKHEQEQNIGSAGKIVAEAISQGGIVHAFGTGHSHMIAEEVFFRAGGIAPINPILDERLIFLKGALESTRAERESGLAAGLLEREDIRSVDAAIIISNSGRNAAPVEMALEMKRRGVRVIAITNLEQSRSAPSRHASGKRLYELADVAVDNCVPTGDALIALDGLNTKTGASSTVAGAAIAHSIIIESLNELLKRGEPVPVLTSANVPGTTAETIREVLSRYRDRIRYLDLETEFE
jgi:uncharacterized phosphosugar-binding protein